MTVTCVYVRVIPDRIDEFIKATIENHEGSVKEPGNLRFDVARQAEDPAIFLIYEAYRSEEDAIAHKSTPHYLKWRDLVAGMMAEPRKGVRYNIIRPLFE